MACTVASACAARTPAGCYAGAVLSNTPSFGSIACCFCRGNVVISPHVYPPTITHATTGFQGPALFNRLTVAHGYLTKQVSSWAAAPWQTLRQHLDAAHAAHVPCATSTGQMSMQMHEIVATEYYKVVSARWPCCRASAAARIAKLSSWSRASLDHAWSTRRTCRSAMMLKCADAAPADASLHHMSAQTSPCQLSSADWCSLQS